MEADEKAVDNINGDVTLCVSRKEFQFKLKPGQPNDFWGPHG